MEIGLAQPGQADLRVLEQQTSLDLVLDDLQAAPVGALPGRPVTLTVTLRNAGDLAARSVTVTFYNGDPAAGAPVIAAPALAKLAGGASTVFSATWTLPNDGRAHRVYAVAATAGAVSETTLTNNTATLELLAPAPRIADGWASYGAGDVVTLTVQVTNEGASPLPPATVSFRRGGSAALIGQAPLPALAPGITLSAEIAWDVVDLPAGVYSVTAAIDSAQPVTRSLAVALLSDLAVGPGDIRVAVGSDNRATAILRAHNLGRRPVEDVPLVLYTGDPAAGGAAWITGVLPWIAAGGSAELSAEWTLPAGADPVYLIVDPAGTVVESDRSNNVALKARDRLPSIIRVYMPLMLKNAGPGTTPGPTFTPAPTLTATPTRTRTSTLIATPTRTRTSTLTATRSPTVTSTAGAATATRTVTRTASPTRTSSPTASRTATASATLTPTPTPTAPGSTWHTIYADGFEGSFPGVWQRLGNPGWGRTNCKAAAGSHSVWAGGDGTGAVTPCVNNYPHNLKAWLIYGPFSLAGASAAELRFQRWQRSEEGFDTLSWLASVDGLNFFGAMDSGDTGGWRDETLDLGDVYGLGDLRGQEQVWVALLFESDADINDVGVFLDEVVIRKK
jgi:hypothetical protein